MEEVKLYGHPLSGHTHKVSLFLSILQLEYEFIIIDLKKQQQKSTSFLSINPLGQVPVLKHNSRIICDSNAILIYLAKTFDKSDFWYPSSTIKQAQVQRLLSIAAGPLVNGPATVRAIKVLNKPGNFDLALETTIQLYHFLEQSLAKQKWMVSNKPTIADVALYSYIKLAEAATDIGQDFPNIQKWQTQVEAIPGFMAVT
ncbi:glutathione S-transferase [Pseudoalteromonas citrea]|uniref:Glutathione S-transferase n=2 Tax=Pseudoalteromonas citrea TaxID=43655 RepID=A0AAD4AFB8_9GAMM|nr:glutathione S-transferase family protein [Pseudoalteromonas citrea]KAF7764803.1 glutathione S-transferase [Pseudoalteromonas citrea]